MREGGGLGGGEGMVIAGGLSHDLVRSEEVRSFSANSKSWHLFSTLDFVPISDGSLNGDWQRWLPGTLADWPLPPLSHALWRPRTKPLILLLLPHLLATPHLIFLLRVVTLHPSYSTTIDLSNGMQPIFSLRSLTSRIDSLLCSVLIPTWIL